MINFRVRNAEKRVSDIHLSPLSSLLHLHLIRTDIYYTLCFYATRGELRQKWKEHGQKNKPLVECSRRRRRVVADDRRADSSEGDSALAVVSVKRFVRHAQCRLAVGSRTVLSACTLLFAILSRFRLSFGGDPDRASPVHHGEFCNVFSITRHREARLLRLF